MPIIFPSVQYIETFINALDNLLIGPFNYEFSLLLINSYWGVLSNGQDFIESVLRFEQIVDLISVDLNITASDQELLVRHLLNIWKNILQGKDKQAVFVGVLM